LLLISSPWLRIAAKRLAPVRATLAAVRGLKRQPGALQASLAGLVGAALFMSLVFGLSGPLPTTPVTTAPPAVAPLVAPQSQGSRFAETDEGLVEVALQMPAKASELKTQPPPPKADQPQRADPAQPKVAPTAPVQTATVSASPAIADRPPPAALPPGERPKIAIVIDDLGLEQSRSRATVDLSGPLTLAFLPYGQNLQTLVSAAKANGHEVIVHVPMEPSAANDPGPNALLTGLPPAEIERRLDWALDQFTGYVGINNHMGSRFTESPAGMALVLDTLADRKIYFLDSRTTGQSAARDLAVLKNIPYAERDVFLDNHRDAPYLAEQLAQTEARARAFGTAIAIGHPHQATIDALRVWMKTLEARGFELVPVSRIIALRQTPLWRVAGQGQRRAG
jgi:uncharacterized protein